MKSVSLSSRRLFITLVSLILSFFITSISYASAFYTHAPESNILNTSYNTWDYNKSYNTTDNGYNHYQYKYNYRYNSPYTYNSYRSCPTLGTNEAPNGCYYQLEPDTNGCQKRQLYCYPTNGNASYYNTTNTSYGYNTYNGSSNYNTIYPNCPRYNSTDRAPSGCLYVYSRDAQNCSIRTLECNNRVYNTYDTFYSPQQINTPRYYPEYNNWYAQPTVEVRGETRYGNTFEVIVQAPKSNSIFEHKIPQEVQLVSLDEGRCNQENYAGYRMLKCQGSERLVYRATTRTGDARVVNLSTKIRYKVANENKLFQKYTRIYTY